MKRKVSGSSDRLVMLIIMFLVLAVGFVVLNTI